MVGESEADEFVDAITEVVEIMHHSGTFWTEALGLAWRVVDI
jgi:hypothetical protein